MKTPSLKSQKTNQPKKLTFAGHLRELRNRVFWWLLVFICGSVVGYIVNDHVLSILVGPLRGPIFYLSPAGGFDFVIRTSLFVGFVVALPVFVYQVLRFVQPAISRKMSWMLPIILISSALLMITGMAFAYFVSLPATLFFLNRFTTDQVQALISTNEYFSFLATYLIGFGLAFQLPLIVLAINAVHRIPVKSLLKFEQWVFFGSFLVAAILTPTPDLFNQVVMALPLILLYQFVVVLIWVTNSLRRGRSSAIASR